MRASILLRDKKKKKKTIYFVLKGLNKSLHTNDYVSLAFVLTRPFWGNKLLLRPNDVVSFNQKCIVHKKESKQYKTHNHKSKDAQKEPSQGKTRN